MFYMNSIDQPRPVGWRQRLKSWIFKAGSSLEALLILGLWLVAFTRDSGWAGMDRQEIIAYLLIGNIIGAFTSYLLGRTINEDIRQKNPERLLQKPIVFLFQTVIGGLGRNLTPFILTICLQAFLLYYLVGWENISFNIGNALLAAAIVALAFASELLLAYLLNFFVFWSLESPESYHILIRLKKALAGNYFPLTILPAQLSGLSLWLPFAYSFYVPAQIFLGQMPASQGRIGLLIQIAWLFILYAIIKKLWQNKQKTSR